MSFGPQLQVAIPLCEACETYAELDIVEAGTDVTTLVLPLSASHQPNLCSAHLLELLKVPAVQPCTIVACWVVLHVNPLILNAHP